MEITIKVKKNDYKEPNLRGEVLQTIVTALTEIVCDNERMDYIIIKDDNPCLYYLNDFSGRVTPFLFYVEDLKTRPNIRLHTCEMKQAFEIIQDAGYYIYGEHLIGESIKYHITKKPYYKNYKCHRVEFGCFID